MHKNSLLVLSMRENAVFLSGFRICKRLQVSRLHFSVQTQGKQANEQKWNPAKISKPSSAQVALARNGSHSRCRRTSGSMPVPIPINGQQVRLYLWFDNFKIAQCLQKSITSMSIRSNNQGHPASLRRRTSTDLFRQRFGLKTRNPHGIPSHFKPRPEEKALAEVACQIVRCCQRILPARFSLCHSYKNQQSF